MLALCPRPPNLDQLKRQAKELLRRQPRLGRLRDAQRVIAQQYGGMLTADDVIWLDDDDEVVRAARRKTRRQSAGGCSPRSSRRENETCCGGCSTRASARRRCSRAARAIFSNTRTCSARCWRTA